MYTYNSLYLLEFLVLLLQIFGGLCPSPHPCFCPCLPEAGSPCCVSCLLFPSASAGSLWSSGGLASEGTFPDIGP